MKTLNLNIPKLSAAETVRYNGPAQNRMHGTYTIRLIPSSSQAGSSPQEAARCVDIHFSLESLIQLKTRIEAALQHMITH